MISFQGFLPNIQTRICTLSMKIFVTNSFLSDWFAQKEGIERLGHFYDEALQTDDDVITTHLKHGGSTPEQILLSKKKYVRSCDFTRKEQLWQDYTNADIVIKNEELLESVFGNKAQLYGDSAVDYVSVLGIRSDEKMRINKIQSRIDKAQNINGNSLFNQPHNESISVPLADENINQKQVIKFWEVQEFNLDLPNSGLFSNCVYCPIKGKARLQQIATMQNGSANSELTPENIDWWIDIEEKYSRNLEAEERETTLQNGTKYISFFGPTKKLVYSEIKKKAKSRVPINEMTLALENAMPCNCTD